VVAAERAEARRELRAAAVAQLLGVQLDRKPSARAASNTRRSARAEGDALAEGVDRIDQAFGMQHGQHAQHLVDVGIGAAGELRRHGMRAEEGGAHGRPMAPRRPAARHAQALASAPATGRSRT
jgi:hypothetical protein